MLIAIPSKGRAGRTSTARFLGDEGTLFVPEAEADLYERAGDSPVRAVPNDIRGITATRNWILDNVTDRRVVFVDDDLKVQGFVRFLERRTKHKRLTVWQWMSEFERLFEVTAGMKYRIWGVSTDGAPRSVFTYRPFLWRSYVTASCMGIINDGKTSFDESFAVKEDYELTLRCIKEDGGIVAARYLYWVNAHWTGSGGCSDYRTIGIELEAIRRLRDMYPGTIRRVTRGGSGFSVELNYGRS
jgi:hypothetical protein